MLARRMLMAAAGGGITYLYDTFTDTNGVSLADHTPDIDTSGAGWTVVTATCDIQSNAARVLATPSVATIDSTASDFTLTVTVTPGNGAASGVIFRRTNATAYWEVTVNDPGNNFLLREYASGYTTRDTANINITGGTPYTVVVTCSGTSISATLDGANTVSFTSSNNQAATVVGLRSANQLSTFDDLTVTA